MAGRRSLWCEQSKAQGIGNFIITVVAAKRKHEQTVNSNHPLESSSFFLCVYFFFVFFLSFHVYFFSFPRLLPFSYVNLFAPSALAFPQRCPHLLASSPRPSFLQPGNDRAFECVDHRVTMRGLTFGHADAHPHLVKDTELDVAFFSWEGTREGGREK